MKQDSSVNEIRSLVTRDMRTNFLRVHRKGRHHKGLSTAEYMLKFGWKFGFGDAKPVAGGLALCQWTVEYGNRTYRHDGGYTYDGGYIWVVVLVDKVKQGERVGDYSVIGTIVETEEVSFDGVIKKKYRAAHDYRVGATIEFSEYEWFRAIPSPELIDLLMNSAAMSL